MRRVYLLLALAMAAAVALVITRQTWLRGLGDFLVVSEPLQHADVIHVISGPDNRTGYAIELYQAGYADQLFFTGGWCSDYQEDHAIHARRLALLQGVPLQAIATDSLSVLTTYQEAEQLKAWIEASPRPVESVLVVSEPFHMRRARWVYQAVLGRDFRVIMAPLPFSQSLYRRDWWTDAASRQMVGAEYLKLGFYYFRYWAPIPALRNWLARFDRMS